MPDSKGLTLADLLAAGSDGLLCSVMAKENVDLDAIDSQPRSTMQLEMLINLALNRAAAPTPKITSSETVYFDDGNIVLVSKDGVAFKVYKGVLMQQSHVFNDMLSFGSDAAAANDLDASDVYDGVLFVRTHDSTENLEILLRLIFDVGAFLYKEFQKAQFEEMLTVAVMAHKYLIKSIYEPCRDILTRTFPSTLAEIFKTRHDCYDAFSYSPRVILRAINVMLRIGLLKPVPYACYVLAFLDQKEVCKIMFEQRALTRYQEILAYRSFVLQMWFTDLGPLFLPPTGEEVCKDPARICAVEDVGKMEEWASSSRNLLQPESYLSHTNWTTLHPLYRLWYMGVWTRATPCSGCSTRPWRKRIKTAQEELWNKLPVTLGLGSWDTLKDIEQLNLTVRQTMEANGPTDPTT